MPIDKKSLALGLAIGGRYNCQLNVEYRALAYNDKGEHDYFYLNYLYPLADLSFGRFVSATVIYGSSTGILTPDNIEMADSRTVKVYANIAGENRIRIFSSADMGVNFYDGSTVPSFGTNFYVDGVVPYELPWMGDGAELNIPALAGADSWAAVYPAYAARGPWTDGGEVTTPRLTGAADGCANSYT